MAKVSIILTLHDVNKLYVRACTNSIKMQSFEDWHIYAIDDYSTKEDYEFLKDWSKVRQLPSRKQKLLNFSLRKLLPESPAPALTSLFISPESSSI